MANKDIQPVRKPLPLIPKGFLPDQVEEDKWVGTGKPGKRP